MGTFKGIGHTAGRYAKRLHHKRTEHKGQYESGYQPFKRVGNFSRSVFLSSSRLFGTVFFGLTFRHKYQSLRCKNNIRVILYKLTINKSGRYKNANYADKSFAGQ
jgi:hypothetical protein